MNRAEERDELALASRRRGHSFAKIAKQLDMANSRDALKAYKRAVRRRPAAEQESIRTGERERFDAMAERVRTNGSLTPTEVTTRLARIERLRAALG